MQNKGFLKVFTVLLALVCIYYLSFSIISSNYESKAEEYAKGNNVKYNAFLDSVAKEKPLNGWFFGHTVKECREKELGMGLDLKGGMNVVMEVSVPDILKSLAGEKSQAAAFEKSIADANEAQKSSKEDYLTLFVNAMKKNSPDTPLAKYFSNRDSKNQIKSNASDAEVIKVLAEDIDVAIENSFNVLRSRIDRFGVIQPNIQRLAGSNRVLIEMPGIKEPERVRRLLQGSANLEFWETTEFAEIASGVIELNNMLKAEQSVETPATKVEEKKEQVAATTDTTSGDLLSQLSQNDSVSTSSAVENAISKDPLFSIFQPAFTEGGQAGSGPRIGFALAKDTAKITEYFREGIKKNILPSTLIPRWTVKPEFGEAFCLIGLYGVANAGKAPKAQLSGEVVTEAKADFEQNSASASVSMEMNSDGARKWASLTKNNINKSVAIVLDGYVYSYPKVNNEITGGRSQITGNFTPDEAKDLANVLKSGKMPAPAKIVQEDIVGPSLGQEAITNGFISFVAAFIMILLYMIFYYGLIPGLVADAALICNVFLIFGVLASFKAVLTLPGIAGIVLTLGMAVDANVLIYERTREEMKKGSEITKAMSDGYSNAMSAIIDSNLTTIITGIILAYFGTGPIKGFATTLIIGIFSSLFTAVFLSRLIFDKIMQNEKYHNLKFTTDLTKNWFQNVEFDFIGKSKKFMMLSLAVIAVGAISLATRGLSAGIDFTGGRNYVIKFENDVKPEEIKNMLDASLEGHASVITIGEKNQVRVSTNYRIDDNSDNVDDDIETRLFESLKPKMNSNVTKNMFINQYVVANGVAQEAGIDDNSTYGIQSSAKVGPTMAYDIMRNAIIAVIIALIGIGLYIFIRFRNIAFSAGSVATLAHDTIIIIGVFSLCYSIMPFSMEVDQQFIAAILTVIGYSINDTVVIYDRIREYRNQYKGTMDEKSIFNKALTSTLSRTFSTSMSTFVVLLVIFLFGGEVIRGFIFAMLIGVIIGTYSSIFIAAPVAYYLLGKKESKEEAQAEEVKA